MKDAYYDENSCLSMVSSNCDDDCVGNENQRIINHRRNNSHSRSRSRSSDRTITSTSSNDAQSDIYDESRASSPELNLIQKNYEENKFKIKHHSTPLVNQQTKQQQQQQTKNILPQTAQQYNLQSFSSPILSAPSPSNMITALQYVQNLKSETQMQISQQQQQQLPSTPQQQQQHKPLSLCAVCGDRASGKHYGVLSCDGCRGFFKRSIRGNMEYVCKESQKCIIDVSRRNQCQACRLKKCLEVKMNRDAVQHQRPPRSLQIKRDTSIIDTAATNILFQNNNSAFLQTKPTGFSAASSLFHPSSAPYSSFYPTRFSPYSIPSSYSASLNSLQWNPNLTTSSSSSPSSSSSSSSSSNGSINLPPPPSAPIPLIPNQSSSFNPFSSSFLATQNAFRQVAAAFAASNTQNEFSVSNTSPNMSTSSSGYLTAEDSGIQDDTKAPKSTKDSIRKEESETKTASPKKSEQQTKIPTDLSIANLIKPSTPKPQQNAAQQLPVTPTTTNTPASSQLPFNWNQMILPTDNIYEMATRILFASVKWARTQRSFLSLPFSDQGVLLEFGWSDLFILTAAETKLIPNESFLLMLMNETNVERKKMIQNFNDTLQRIASARIDAMEYYLLKSIIIYRSEIKEIREKIKVDAIQEECLNALLNHTKTNYASTVRYGRLLLLIADIRKYSSKSIEDLFFKHFLGTNTINNLLFDIFKSC